MLVASFWLKATCFPPPASRRAQYGDAAGLSRELRQLRRLPLCRRARLPRHVGAAAAAAAAVAEAAAAAAAAAGACGCRLPAWCWLRAAPLHVAKRASVSLTASEWHGTVRTQALCRQTSCHGTWERAELAVTESWWVPLGGGKTRAWWKFQWKDLVFPPYARDRRETTISTHTHLSRVAQQNGARRSCIRQGICVHVPLGPLPRSNIAADSCARSPPW